MKQLGYSIQQIASIFVLIIGFGLLKQEHYG